jgi:c-di-GMP-binding flagellar brake protein YcgR
VSDERRQHYRVSTSTDREISVRVGLQDGSQHPVGLIDISAGGVALALGADEALPAKINETVTIIFESDRLGQPLEISSHLRHIKMSDDDANIIYGVSFDPWDENRLNLTPKLRSLFNEREAVRVEPSDDGEIDVQLVFNGRGTVLNGLLRDISVLGLGVWLNTDDAPSLNSASTVALDLTLPTCTEPLHLEVEVRHRAPIGERSRVGMHFTDKDRKTLTNRQKVLTNYVMARQIENARIDAERRRAMGSHYPTR